MSFHVFFMFSSGLENTLIVPKGTLKSIMTRVQHIESVLGLKREKYENNPVRWVSTKPTNDISDEIYCSEAEDHNGWVRWLYSAFESWSETPAPDGEPLTPKDAEKFWHALSIIDVPPHRWTGEYYRERMESLYEVMRGRESEGVSFDDTEPLSPEQASKVIWAFEPYLNDPEDQRLEVPKGHDSLFSSDDYVWCDKCGAIAYDDRQNELISCEDQECPLRKEHMEEYKELMEEEE